MDNPAVSAPAVPGRLSDQQTDIIGTETKTETPTPSSGSEPVTTAMQMPSKNNEGWRRVVRNFSPSCESTKWPSYIAMCCTGIDIVM
jgi:hypothetical protein